MISKLIRDIKWRVNNAREKLQQFPIIYRIARGAFWSLFGGVFSRAFTIITTILVARFLGKEGFGEIAMVQSTLGMLGILAGLGLGMTATKYISEFLYKEKEKVTRILCLTIVISCITGVSMMLICWNISSWLSSSALSNVDMLPLLKLGAIFLLISALESVVSASLIGFEAFRSIAKVSIWQGVSVPFVTIPLVWLYGEQGAISAMIVSSSIGMILSLYALRRECKKHDVSTKYDGACWSEWPVILKFSLPSMLSGAVAVPVIWMSNAILVNQPGGYGEMGLFNAANQWRLFISFIPAYLSAAMLPVLSDTHGRDSHGEFRKTISLNLKVTWVIAFPLTVVCIIFGQSLAALFGKEFLGSSEMIAVLMLSSFLNIINGVVGTALAGSGRMWVGVLMNFGWGIALIGSTILLVPEFNGLGLAYSYLFAYFLHTIWVMGYVELKLAKTVISSESLLIAFTSCVLLLCFVFISIDGDQYYYLNYALILLSLLPLIHISNQKLKKFNFISNEI